MSQLDLFSPQTETVVWCLDPIRHTLVRHALVSETGDRIIVRNLEDSSQAYERRADNRNVFRTKKEALLESVNRLSRARDYYQAKADAMEHARKLAFDQL